MLKKIFYSCIILILYISTAFGQVPIDDCPPVDINSGDPNFPFPQFLEYNHGKTLAENNAEGVTHADMEKSMREGYEIMMHRCRYSGEELNGVKYIVFNPDEVPANWGTFVSEGDGYALLAAAYFADKPTFDGLWLWIHDHRLSGVTRYEDCTELRPDYRYGDYLPGWKCDASDPAGGTDVNSATDGDFDIAMGLLLAYKQWGEYMGINDACGNPISYKDAAESMITAIVDTLTLNNVNGGFSGIMSGDIGIDGYVKNGNTWAETTTWRTTPANTAYPWAQNNPEAYSVSGLYTDYVGPAYFKQFAMYMDSQGARDWISHQYIRGEASSDWLIGKLYEQGGIASSGSCSITNDGSVVSFGQHPSGPEGEDFRLAWRTILNYVWHGNPEYTWDPVTHEVINVPNTFEYDMGIRHAERMKAPWSSTGTPHCGTFGSSPDPASPSFTGPAHIPQFWSLDGVIGGTKNRVNYNVGAGAPAAVASEDLELIADIWRQSDIMWDDASYKSSGLTAEERYIKSTPGYFHGWFRLLGMLTTSGNLHPPLNMDPAANMKVYMSVDKTYAYQGDLITYTVDYRNYGKLDATGVTITTPLDPNYDFISASHNGTFNGTSVTWDIGTVNGFTSAGGVDASSGKVTFTVRANGIANPRICLQTTISSNNAPDWVSNEYPNNATYTMERNCVDILASRTSHVTKTTNRPKMNPNDIVEFFVEFENESVEGSWLDGGR
ncbi:MAG: glycosyl hydrolase family 8, partial [Bacteroidota bacterium]